MSWLNVPLPWMIGPMVLAAAFGLTRLKPDVPQITRPVGQAVVAASVGLFFTPDAVTAVSQQIVPMVVATFMTIAAGFLVAMLLMRLTRLDVVTACLASIPGGPVEMAALAERHGAQPGPVAFAQTLRIALLVMIIPPLLVALDGTAAAPGTTAWEGHSGAPLLLLTALGGGIFFQFFRISSPFFLGPLAAAAVASALMLPVSPPPYFVLAGAQVLLGVWLGGLLDRELFDRAGVMIVPAIFASTILLLILCALMAVAISAATGIAWQTMILATAPGSVTEMALTAKILQQGVALVTAFHVFRIFVIIPTTPLIFGLVAKWAARSEG